VPHKQYSPLGNYATHSLLHANITAEIGAQVSKSAAQVRVCSEIIMKAIALPFLSKCFPLPLQLSHHH
jgi:hypothetical protein